jgi:signal transduction histidine kinase
MLEMKKYLIRFISHEIRTPLNAASMGLHILKRELERYQDGKQIDYRDIITVVEEIDNACDASLEILNDVLTYEKVDAGILVLHKSKLTAYSILSDCIRIFVLQV